MGAVATMYVWDLRVRSRRNQHNQNVVLGINDEYLDLDPVASSMWLRFETPSSIEQASEAIALEYDTDQTIVLPDVKNLVDTLCEAGMLRTVEGL